MAFLYSTYIVINAVLSVVLGRVFDNDFTKNGNIRFGLKMVGGWVFFFNRLQFLDEDWFFLCL